MGRTSTGERHRETDGERVINKQQLIHEDKSKKKKTNKPKGPDNSWENRKNKLNKREQQSCQTRTPSPLKLWAQTLRVNKALLSTYHSMHPQQHELVDKQQIIFFSFSATCCTEPASPASAPDSTVNLPLFPLHDKTSEQHTVRKAQIKAAKC